MGRLGLVNGARRIPVAGVIAIETGETTFVALFLGAMSIWTNYSFLACSSLNRKQRFIRTHKHPVSRTYLDGQCSPFPFEMRCSSELPNWWGGLFTAFRGGQSSPMGRHTQSNKTRVRDLAATPFQRTTSFPVKGLVAVPLQNIRFCHHILACGLQVAAAPEGAVPCAKTIMWLLPKMVATWCLAAYLSHTFGCCCLAHDWKSRDSV